MNDKLHHQLAYQQACGNVGFGQTMIGGLLGSTTLCCEMGARQSQQSVGGFIPASQLQRTVGLVRKEIHGSIGDMCE